MSAVSYTLVSDGSADRALIPVLDWLLRQLVIDITIQSNWADPRRLSIPRADLAGRIRSAVDTNPCDLLFVHRDAEAESLQTRRQQVLNAIQEAQINLPAVCIIPVRMQEAWLLFDEQAIREASGNPNGRTSLDLPDPKRLEDVADPKAVLYEALRAASGLSARRRNALRIPQLVHRVAELIQDFTLLQELTAFAALRSELEQNMVLLRKLNSD